MRPFATAALLALVLASCGGSDDTSSSSSSSSASNDPCARPAGFKPAGSVLPSNVVPEGTLVGDLKRDGRSVSGSAFFDSSLNDAYANLKAGGANAGYQLAGDDNEGFEAELLFIRAGDEELGFKLREIQGCATGTGGTFSRGPARPTGQAGLLLGGAY